MTSSKFKEVIYKLDSNLGISKKILLLLDNCPSHSDLNSLLTNIKLVFLLPNLTSILESMDGGVIQNFKMTYKKVITSLIRHYEMNDNKLKHQFWIH